MGRRKRDVSEVYEELKKWRSTSESRKTKAVVQNRRRRRIREILTIKDHVIAVVRSFTYLGTAINNTNGETEEIKARILGANRAYSSLKTIFVSKQFHRDNKISLYEVLSQYCVMDMNTVP